MCGIAGIFNLTGQPVEHHDVRAITRVLAHRGPDGEGIYTSGPIGLGHRRLAILDLTESGKQPMPCVEGRYLVTFNGEIFNFVELRRELEASGHRFHSESDTEVIGHAYHRWGADCVLRFNGMWAFAIWDTERRELFLSRDHFGIKPLFYLAEPGRFAFASELKSFVHLPQFTARENHDVMNIALFDAGYYEQVDDTLLEGVRRLHSGHNMLVSRSKLKVWRWWRTLDHLPPVPRRLRDQAQEFRELFLDACRLRLRSDVPIATCLSGGVDSSAVICSLAALRDQSSSQANEREAVDSQRAFVATYPGTPKDESAFAELAIQRSGAEPRYRQIEPETVIDALYEFAYAFENIGGSLMMPLWRIYRELRRDGVVVSLDGHGGDELLAGYMHYVSGSLQRVSFARRPWRTIDLARTLAPMNGPGSMSTQRLLARQLRQLSVLDAVAGRLRPRPPSAVSGVTWAGPSAVAVPVLASDEREAEAMASLSSLGRELYAAVHHYHLPHILRNFERCSMAHGVEVRMPFLDWRLVCYAFALPDESKLGGGFTKRVLREAMRGVMPEELRRRKDKIGFSPPLAHWFNRGLGDWVVEQVQSRSFLEDEVWNGPAIRDFAMRCGQSGTWRPRDCERIWPFMQAQLWRQTLLEAPRRTEPARETVHAAG
jgi:asparagine synthase (glutamine-hydrolysing)